MPRATIKSELVEHIKKLTSKDGVDEGIKSLLIEKARRELLKYDSIVKDFEKKYNMNFKQFGNSELMKEPSFEIEQDYFDWEMAVTVIEDVKEELEKLEKKTK